MIVDVVEYIVLKDSEMAGASEEGVTVEENVAQEPRRRGLSGSMSLRTRKLGRRLSRSMSIVALKLPEKAQSITRTSTKLMRSGSRDKKNRSFELSIILPDKTQRQVNVVTFKTKYFIVFNLYFCNLFNFVYARVYLEIQLQ